ncbi:helix-turn-helix domain-containing protein (plasmid) [Deinococcus metallilatus]|uniref:Excisionase family DNA binding protein n=1 Tax=Deinococcus metallilatus TaxID=1211322 RepID=A0AAJ5K1I9_9DEIO|nr:helix-turn-helix domain-containing protein [Deinococcus metallilatus]MBB5293431.1 excisionase family DNA binding protein [Deinococcus metallilatus]QBY06523.1 helix-turn-helix domain-containing protein [Deinococcus metallilatus]RXJ17866.1 helix-turn-helix domain-containing protein [Deinococcus metallilatus]TLK32138.1 helix-turn-helix domain-containing protein [Deinococcus metallilatus]GMA15349.1 hypothetical protein GCM10025871_16800 [Deinococcus metallilatus]
MTTSFFPTPADTQAAQQQLERFNRQPDFLLPRLAGLMTELLSQLAAGKAVQITALESEITTQQAADLLKVSRPYVVKLLEAGELPHRKVGPRRRLRLDDVLAYKGRLDTQRLAALQVLAADLQEMGLD